MIYVAYFIGLFLVYQCVVIAINMVWKQFLREGVIIDNPLISILIPARNEEKNIGLLLHDLQLQSYANVEILVYDDMSSDSTCAIVSELSQIDSRIRLISGTSLPEGWLGKNYACYSLAAQARGSYFLFLDADVRVQSMFVNKILYAMQKRSFHLLSIFPRQIMKTFGEKITVPIMNYILLSLLPLVFVRIPWFSSLSAANGQCMMFEAASYKKLEPHARCKASKAEDISIARFYKKQKCSIVCLASETDIYCRMYNSFSDAKKGFAKNIVYFFGGSYVLACLFWIITTFGFIPLLYVSSAWFVLAYVLVIILQRMVISVISHQHVFFNSILVMFHQCVMGLLICTSILYKFKRTFVWKGRNIS